MIVACSVYIGPFLFFFFSCLQSLQAVNFCKTAQTVKFSKQHCFKTRTVQSGIWNEGCCVMGEKRPYKL